MYFGVARTAALWATFVGLVSACLQGAPLTVDLTNGATALASAILGNGTTMVGTPVLSGQLGQAGLRWRLWVGVY